VGDHLIKPEISKITGVFTSAQCISPEDFPRPMRDYLVILEGSHIKEISTLT
jgi:hypothetical protein